MKFDLKKPCVDCPFRTDKRAFLTPERAEEITDALLRQDQTFTCHKTISGEQDEDDSTNYIPGVNGQFCAGALIFLQHNGSPNRTPRFGIFAGIFDPAKLDMDAPVFKTQADMVDAQRSDIAKLANKHSDALKRLAKR